MKFLMLASVEKVYATEHAEINQLLYFLPGTEAQQDGDKILAWKSP